MNFAEFADAAKVTGRIKDEQLRIIDPLAERNERVWKIWESQPGRDRWERYTKPSLAAFRWHHKNWRRLRPARWRAARPHCGQSTPRQRKRVA